MAKRQAVVVVCVLVAGLIGLAATRDSPASARVACAAGAKAAVIAGKHVCLKAGGRCEKRLDRAYHRYRFHCHSGRLAPFSAPAPKPMPTAADPAGAAIARRGTSSTLAATACT